MRTSLLWSDRLQDESGNTQPIHAVTWITPNHVLAAAGPLLLLYETLQGTLLNTLSSHKDVVYALAFSSSTNLAASAGADNTVILWNVIVTDIHVQVSPLVKYSHPDSVQCLAFSPISGVLCSGSSSEMGLWNPESRTVSKSKVKSRINSCAWSSDGQFIALGMYDGTVSVKTNSGDEHAVIHRDQAAPVWSLQWNPTSRYTHSKHPHHTVPSKRKPCSSTETLLVTDWNQKVALYLPSGTLIGNDRDTGCDPTAVSYSQNGMYVLVAGSNGTITLWSVSGDTLIKTGPVFEQPNAWIWSISMSPAGQQFAVVTEQGDIAVHQLSFQTVHALFQNRYAFRSGLTDVVIQHFDGQSGQTLSCQLSCRDYVRKIAMFGTKFAVLLSTRILVYEYVSHSEDYESESGLADMFVGMLLSERSINSDGNSVIRKKKSQATLEYQLHNKINLFLECNLLVMTSNHLLFCIETNLAMYDLDGTKEREWRLPSLIRYIKVVGGPAGREAVLVGMRDGCTYLVYIDNPFPILIAQHTAPIRCLDMNRTRTRIAILDDSEICSVYSLESFTGKAKLEYQESGATSAAWNTDHDDLLCYSGKSTISVKAGSFPSISQPNAGFVVGFKGAKLFILHQSKLSVIQVPLATCMHQYIERREWAYAIGIAYLGAGTDGDWIKLGHAALEDLQILVARRCYSKVRDHRTLMQIGIIDDLVQAGTSRDVVVAEVLAMHGKFDQAASLFCTKGHAQRAVDMYTDLGMYERALKLAKTHSLPEDKILQSKAAALYEQNDYEAAADTYLQVGEVSQAVQLLVTNAAVERLVLVVQTSGDKMDSLTLQKCVQFFRSKDRLDIVAALLSRLRDWKALVQLHIAQNDFDSAFTVAKDHGLESEVELPYAQYLLLKEDYAGALVRYKRAGRPDLAVRLLKQLRSSALAQQCHLDSARASFRLDEHGLADTLYAYHYIFDYLSDPFTSLPLSTLLSMARFLVIQMHQSSKTNLWMPELSRVSVIVALARLALASNAFKLCAEAVALSTEFRIPAIWQSLIDSVSIKCKGALKHETDQDMVHLCYACSAAMPLLATDPRCKSCHVPATYAFHSFDPLPVVQYVVTDAPEIPPIHGGEDDPMLHFISLCGPLNEYPIPVDRCTANRFKEEHIIHAGPLLFYRVLTDVAIKACPGCFRLFHADEYEYLQLVHFGCPLCQHDDLGLKQIRKTNNTLTTVVNQGAGV